MAAPVGESPARRPRSWAKLLLALALFLFILPGFRFWVPIEQPALVLVPIVAACAIVGWLRGAKPWIAIVWTLLAIWFLLLPAGPAGTPYDRMARGWALLLAGSFGLVSLWNSTAPFIVRTLGALGLAAGTAFILAVASPGGVVRFQRAATLELRRRSKETEAGLQALVASPQWREKAAKSPDMEATTDQVEAWLKRSAEDAAPALPALVALESLAALALGWALYHRIASAPIGPPLSPLREFRFNDQLIWGVAVGATLLMLPQFQEGRTAGINLLIFFGSLYFIRGVGVLLWMSRGRMLAALILGVLLFMFALGGGWPPGIAGGLLLLPFAFIGFGDTWLDWRRRAGGAAR